MQFHLKQVSPEKKHSWERRCFWEASLSGRLRERPSGGQGGSKPTGSLGGGEPAKKPESGRPGFKHGLHQLPECGSPQGAERSQPPFSPVWDGVTFLLAEWRGCGKGACESLSH